MDDNSDTELELYEEIVDDIHYVSPPGSSPHSPRDVNVNDPSPSQDPMEFHDNTLTSFTPTKRPALRSELATDRQESQTVDVTMAPERGARMDQRRNHDGNGLARSELPVCTDVSTALSSMPRSVASTSSYEQDHSRPTPTRWMSAIKTQLDT